MEFGQLSWYTDRKLYLGVQQSSDTSSPPLSVPGGGSFLIGAFRGHFSCSGFCLAVKVSLTCHSINYQPLMVFNETKWGSFSQICLNCIAALNLIADVMHLIDWLINRKQNVNILKPYLLLISVRTNLLINPLFFHQRRSKNEPSIMSEKPEIASLSSHSSELLNALPRLRLAFLCDLISFQYI